MGQRARVLIRETKIQHKQNHVRDGGSAGISKGGGQKVEICLRVRIRKKREYSEKPSRKKERYRVVLKDERGLRWKWRGWIRQRH